MSPACIPARARIAGEGRLAAKETGLLGEGAPSMAGSCASLSTGGDTREPGR